MTTSERDAAGRWLPTVSGNPRARPVGSGRVAEMREKIAAALEDDVLQVIQAGARAGDAAMCRLLLDRVIGPARPVAVPEEPIPMLGGTLAAQAARVIELAARGAIALDTAGELVAGLVQLSNIREADEILARLEAIERRVGSERD